MAKVVNCECGDTVHGENEDHLVQQVEAHVNDAHPELVGKLSREEILAMAEEKS